MDPPKPAPIDMRHTKLKASEAALLAGELEKPTWASRNEGIHERVSFEDTLWGFEMAGGAYYKTPLRVAYVRPGSRAEHACIRMGDTVLRINGKDTANLTLQEAHQLVLEAGINLKIVVTAPEDKVNAHYDYEDPMITEPVLTPEQLKAMELERVRKALERASRCQELPWPWVRRKWVIYRESNCFMVPSKYENKHREKFPELPAQKLDYFFPVDKNNQAKNKKITDDTKTLNGNMADETLEDNEEYEEVEEEVDEEVGEEEETKEKNKLNHKIVNQQGSERLEDKVIDNDDNNLEKNVLNKNLEINDSNNLEQEDPIDNNIIESSQRKDSNQSVSSYELDNNNNHVAKHKDEKTDEERQHSNQDSDDGMLDEIIENSNRTMEENTTKSDDDVIDSVLNDNEGSEFENER